MADYTAKELREIISKLETMPNWKAHNYFKANYRGKTVEINGIDYIITHHNAFSKDDESNIKCELIPRQSKPYMLSDQRKENISKARLAINNCEFLKKSRLEKEKIISELNDYLYKVKEGIL